MNQKLKIALLVLPWMALPPEKYAGTERIVYALTEGLVKKGHDVTLFSVGETKTSAHLEYIFKKPLGLQSDVYTKIKTSFYPLMHVANCFEQHKKFDIIHSHAQFLGLPFAAITSTASLHTFHIDLKDLQEDEGALVKRYGHLSFTSLSNSQRIEGVNYLGTVYNGVDTNKYTPSEKPKRNYILWVGRITSKKGTIDAIKTAKLLNMPLILAGRVTEESYFEEVIKKEIDGKQIRYIGNVSTTELASLYREALCVMDPIHWEEPFGLVMAEAMACGTPVTAYNRGSVSEILRDGLTGFIIEPEDSIGESKWTVKKKGIDGLVEGVKRIGEIDRKACRKHVEENFTDEKMVDSYEKIYYQLTNL